MPWYMPIGEVAIVLAAGIFIASAGWWLSLKAVPRRCETCRPAHGRHERGEAEPELEPSGKAIPPERVPPVLIGEPEATQALPPLTDSGEFPPAWWNDEPLGRGWWRP